MAAIMSVSFVKWDQKNTERFTMSLWAQQLDHEKEQTQCGMVGKEVRISIRRNQKGPGAL